MFKTCSKCNLELDIIQFDKCKSNKDGIKGWCKECTKQYKASWKAKNLNKIIEYNEAYRTENRDTITERNRDWRNSNVVHRAEYAKEYMVEYYKENKDILSEKKKKYKGRYSETKKKWYMDNKELIMAYYIKNKGKRTEYRKIYVRENKEKFRGYNQKREAIKNKLAHTLTHTQWGDIKNYFNNKCCYCGKELQLQQEHFLALSKGGEYTLNNILPACISCNSSKNAEDFFIWYAKYRYYNKTRERKILKFLNYNNKFQQLALTI